MGANLPELGSLAVHSPRLKPQTVRVLPSTCHDLSLFKDLLKEYRRLDDTITMRLNRSNAQFRDQARLGSSGKGTLQDQACNHLWHELIGNWKRRKELVNFCVGVVDESIQEKRTALEGAQDSPALTRKTQAALFEDEVKRNQVHNELAVEEIIRERSINVFRSRCKYFQPPLPDEETRKWWNSA